MPLRYIHALAIVNRHKTHVYTSTPQTCVYEFCQNACERSYFCTKPANRIFQSSKTNSCGLLKTPAVSTLVFMRTNWIKSGIVCYFHFTTPISPALLFSNLNSGLGENKFGRTTEKWHYYNMTATSRISRNTETTFAHWLISEKEDDFIKLNVSRCHSDCH